MTTTTAAAAAEASEKQQPGKSNESETKLLSINVDCDDLGHRHGNFHKYYDFHPPSTRMELLHNTGVFEFIAKRWKEQHQGNKNNKRRRLESSVKKVQGKDRDGTVFSYGDVGCNEGALTIEIASAIHKALDEELVEFTGIDIDDVLISRAKSNLSTHSIKGKFMLADVCNPNEFDCAFPKMVDFMSVLSTTMWIHVHGGDEGLRNVLQRICSKTRYFLLIEPQPSKCYRKAVVRLRKLGRPQLDVSEARLKMRPKIEEEIQTMLNEFGFQPVNSCGKESEGMAASTKRTKWNRALQLYERVSPSPSV